MRLTTCLLVLFLVGAPFSACVAEVRPDPEFGGSGRVEIATPRSLENSGGTSVLALPDQRLLLATSLEATAGTAGELLLARLNINGSIDSSFGSAGLVRHSLGLSAADAGRALQVVDLRRLPDGRLMVLCHSQTYGASNAPRRLVLARLNADGSLDGEFNGVGYRWLDPTLASDSYFYGRNARLIALGADWLVASFDSRYSQDHLAYADLFKLHADGSFVTGFGGTGRVYSELGLNSQGLDAMSLPGSQFQLLVYNAGVISWRRFLGNGAIDATYGNGGTFVLPTNEAFDTVYVFPDGRLYASGGSFAFRLDQQGRAMAGFQSSVAYDVYAMQPYRGNEILVASYFEFGGTPPPDAGSRLQSLRSDGQVVREFGNAGIYLREYRAHEAVAVDASNRIVMAGAEYSNASAVLTVYRYVDVRAAVAAAEPIPAASNGTLAIIAGLLVLVGLAGVRRHRQRFTAGSDRG